MNPRTGDRTITAPMLRNSIVACVCALIPMLTGCTERRIRVTSEPAGAIVWLNDVEIGRTPTETSFKFYGTYDVRVELDGHEPLITTADASTPWWEYPGPDLIAEAIPGRKSIIDWHFVLEPKLNETMGRDELEEGMIDRARKLRDELGPAPMPEVPARAPESVVGTPASGDASELAPNGGVPRNNSSSPND